MGGGFWFNIFRLHDDDTFTYKTFESYLNALDEQK